MIQQLYTEHQQSPRPEVTHFMGGAEPGVEAGQGWGGLPADLGLLLYLSRLWGEPGRWVASLPGSLCAAPCSDLPSYGSPHTFQVMPTPSPSVCASARLLYSNFANNQRPEPLW